MSAPPRTAPASDPEQMEWDAAVKPSGEEEAPARDTVCRVARTVALVALLLAFSYGWNWTLHSKYCNTLFSCGCTWPWAGGSAHCNIHNPTGPKCPWCNVMNIAPQFAWSVSDWFNVVAMTAFGALVGSVAQKGGTGKQILVMCIAAAAFWVAYGTVNAWAFWRFTDYPYFLWWTK
eukprot:TRINITY_DN5536_c0_g1_i1.p2 TRINITY_DN5536_c0_g1~~TRINITY_DN5536_c0_g1_i1.p2  ORF type:complete len:202 (+),score=71.98 TRINITY_DN5536_c0_g1_i1:79-606(+)